MAGISHTRKIVLALVLISLVPVFITSFFGLMSFNQLDFTAFETIRGEKVLFQSQGLYRFNAKPLVMEGIGWDAVRLLVMLPLLIVSTLFYTLRNSKRAAFILLGTTAAFVYHYFSWAIAWAYNSFFLFYVFLYSLFLLIAFFCAQDLYSRNLPEQFTPSFPRKTIIVFNFMVALLVAILWFKEIIPTIWPSRLPEAFQGIPTLYAQILDLGLIVPLALASSIFLLKRHALGYLFSSLGIIMFVSMAFSIIAGAVLSGIYTGKPDLSGIIMFCILGALALLLFVFFLRAYRPGTAAEIST